MNVLVIGKGGYIGESFTQYVREKYSIQPESRPGGIVEAEPLTVDVVDSYTEWIDVDFKNYSTILFAAGIAHCKQTPANKHLYYEVNRDLAIKIAKKAKSVNVAHFIYLSSMSVFGQASNEQPEITANETPIPRHNDYYGHSKFEAEIALHELADENLSVSIIRPPMVYGRECPGKFHQLVKLSRFMPIVPDTQNARSMIYIDNLSEFLCKIIISRKNGIFHPQNSMHTNTACLIKLIRKQMKRETITSKPLGKLIRLLMPGIPTLANAFGSMYYTAETADYQKTTLESSVKQSIDSLCE